MLRGHEYFKIYLRRGREVGTFTIMVKDPLFMAFRNHGANHKLIFWLVSAQRLLFGLENPLYDIMIQ